MWRWGTLSRAISSTRGLNVAGVLRWKWREFLKVYWLVTSRRMSWYIRNVLDRWGNDRIFEIGISGFIVFRNIRDVGWFSDGVINE